MPKLVARYDRRGRALALAIDNPDTDPVDLTIGGDEYGTNQSRSIRVAAGGSARARWPVAESQNWYDVIVTSDGVSFRLAGRFEDGKSGVSDPLMYI